MRTVTDVDGEEVQVPADPQRVVTLSEPTTDAALALEAKLIGVVSGRGQSTVANYLKEKASGIPILGGVAQPNYEQIAKNKPDLILVDGTSINNNQEALDTLAKIAPVVYTGYAGGDWRENLQITADALNKAAEAQELIDAYDQRVAEVSSQLQANGYDQYTYSIVRWQGTSAALILKELPAGRALTDLGLKRPENQDRYGRGHSDPVSLENMADIDADYMFFGTLGGSSVGNPQAGGSADDQAAADAIEQAATVAGFTDLQAYQSGHIIAVDGSRWTSTGGPILMSSIIDDVENALLGS